MSRATVKHDEHTMIPKPLSPDGACWPVGDNRGRVRCPDCDRLFPRAHMPRYELHWRVVHGAMSR